MRIYPRFTQDLTVDLARYGDFANGKVLVYATTNHLAERILIPTWHENRGDGAEGLTKIMRAREKPVLAQAT